MSERRAPRASLFLVLLQLFIIQQHYTSQVNSSQQSAISASKLISLEDHNNLINNLRSPRRNVVASRHWSQLADQEPARPRSLTGSQSYGLDGHPSRRQLSQQKQREQQQQQHQSDSLLVCPEGWHQHSTQCYRFFHQKHSWLRAKDICEKYGGQLASIHDYQQNNFTSQLASSSFSSSINPTQPGTAGSASSLSAPDLHGHGSYQAQQGGKSSISTQALFASDEQSYWIGYRAIDRLETNTLETAANTFVSKYTGFWDYDEPQVNQGECVRATVRHETGVSPANSYKLVSQTSGES